MRILAAVGPEAHHGLVVVIALLAFAGVAGLMLFIASQYRDQ